MNNTDKFLLALSVLFLAFCIYAIGNVIYKAATVTCRDGFYYNVQTGACVPGYKP